MFGRDGRGRTFNSLTLPDSKSGGVTNFPTSLLFLNVSGHFRLHVLLLTNIFNLVATHCSLLQDLYMDSVVSYFRRYRCYCMVELRRIELRSKRCKRPVIPLYYSPIVYFLDTLPFLKPAGIVASFLIFLLIVPFVIHIVLYCELPSPF